MATDNGQAVATSECHTRSVMYHCSQKWTIDDFSYFNAEKAESLFICSSSFFPPEYPDLKFYVKLYPKSDNEERQDYVSIFIFYDSQEKREVSVKYSICLIDEKGKKCNLQRFIPSTFISGKTGWGKSKFILRANLLDPSNGLLPDDKLTIFCEVNALSERITNESSLSYWKVLSRQAICDNWNSLLESGQQSDVTLAIGLSGKVIRAHKIVLTTRSPVFEAMFRHDTKENRESLVSMPDISGEVGELFVRYLYTGTISQLEKYAMELLIVADKYGTDLLKQLCGQTLLATIDTKTVAKLLLISDRHSVPELKLACMHYIKKHIAEVMLTEDWNLVDRLVVQSLRDMHFAKKQLIWSQLTGDENRSES